MHSTAKSTGKRTLKRSEKNDREKKKFQREYQKYSEPKKYEEYLKKERERKQRGMYLGFHIAVVRATETQSIIEILTEHLSNDSCIYWNEKIVGYIDQHGRSEH